MFTVVILLKGRLFNTELFEIVVFRLFNGADSTVQIIFRGMRNYSVIMISTLQN
jgi:hypothetical protein